MIVFDLRCARAHVFEAWFGSTADYESQNARGLIACPLCSSREIGKAVMAPAVAAKGNRRPDAAPRDAAPAAPPASEAADSPELLPALLAMQRQFEAGSDYVGSNFATAARAMHEGDAPARSIHGEASLAEARALQEDGISVLPLPFRPLAGSDA
jgi:hypothetical protein